jgi:hypothetical protein
VHYESSEVDERTGERFQWRHGMDSHKVKAHLDKVNSGKMLDPFGEPWKNVRAWIEVEDAPSQVPARRGKRARTMCAAR